MSGMDRLTELLPCPFCGVEPCMYDDVNHSKACYISCQTEGCIGEMTWHENDAEAIAAWNRRASQAAPAPSDHLVSVGKASGLIEARVSLAARQIRQTLRDYGHRCAETSLPELIAADVDAALRKQDQVHAPAPSDGLREALERIGWHDLTAIEARDVARAALSAPAQEGGE